MLLQIAIGSALMIVTTIVHASGMAVGLNWLAKMRSNPHVISSNLYRALAVAILVLIMFLATLIEAGVWAVIYFALGAFSDFEEALYFSTVTYTTLGYGDIVLQDPWRLLSSFEAANGIVMFGWTTALIVVAIHGFSKTLQKVKALD